MMMTYRVSTAPTTEERRQLTAERWDTIAAAQERAEAVVGEDGAGWAEWADETTAEVGVCALLRARDLIDDHGACDVYAPLAVIYRRRV